MKIKLNKPATARTREEIAKLAAATVDAGLGRADTPYKPNDDDDTFWTVDQGNDWKLKFSEFDPSVFMVEHRYRDKSAVEGLTRWLAYRLGAELID